jgi:glutaredoxin 3
MTQPTNDKIIIYGAEWCGFCHMVMRYLDDKKIGYNYIDVDEKPQAGKDAVEKSGQRGIPVIDMDGEIIVGFDRPKIDNRLKSMQLV